MSRLLVAVASRHGAAVASALHAPEGDFRDRDAIEAWAGQIAEATPNR
jgi:hypothetical protein